MRLKVSESKNAASYYVIKDYYSNGKRTTKIVEKLGTHDELGSLTLAYYKPIQKL